MNAATRNITQLEKGLSSLERKNQLLKKTKEELMSTCSDEKIVVKKHVRKLVKSIPTRFVGMVMFVSQAIPKWRWWDKSEL